MTSDPRIIFYGTPDFAVASLRRLIEEGFNVVSVVTSPDKPAGRGLKVADSPVKEFAISSELPLLQPANMKDPGFHAELKALDPDLQIVVAFRMMPKDVWTLPRFGTFNLHASLLPQYRGAAPINWAIINGETETGVTTFFLEEKIDTGQIIFTEKALIGPEETAGELRNRLMELGAGLVVKTVRAIVTGTVNAIPQTGLASAGSVLKPAPKFSREDARIDWSKDHRDVFNLIRGMSPQPGAFTEIPLKDGSLLHLKILRAIAEPEPGTLAGSGFQTDLRTFLKIPAKDGFIRLQEIQPAGKRVMNIGEFLNGSGRLIS
jgi:methionyl-tRNA formyltransferase